MLSLCNSGLLWIRLRASGPSIRSTNEAGYSHFSTMMSFYTCLLPHEVTRGPKYARTGLYNCTIVHIAWCGGFSSGCKSNQRIDYTRPIWWLLLTVIMHISQKQWVFFKISFGACSLIALTADALICNKPPKWVKLCFSRFCLCFRHHVAVWKGTHKCNLIISVCDSFDDEPLTFRLGFTLTYRLILCFWPL